MAASFHTYTDEQLDRARHTLHDAITWQGENPRAWDFIVRTALDLGANGKRIGAQRLIEDVRARDFTDELGMPTKTNNNYAPVFARLLVYEHPHLLPLVELRSSAIDAIMHAGGVYLA